MGTDTRVVTDLDMLVDDRIGTHGNAGAKFGTGMNDGGWMNHGTPSISVNIALCAHQFSLGDHISIHLGNRVVLPDTAHLPDDFHMQMQLIPCADRLFEACIVNTDKVEN